MVFERKARQNSICGNCKYYSETCQYPEMKGVKIEHRDTPCICEAKYFKSKDDFETSGR